MGATRDVKGVLEYRSPKSEGGLAHEKAAGRLTVCGVLHGVSGLIVGGLACALIFGVAGASGFRNVGILVEIALVPGTLIILSIIYLISPGRVRAGRRDWIAVMQWVTAVQVVVLSLAELYLIFGAIIHHEIGLMVLAIFLGYFLAVVGVAAYSMFHLESEPSP